MGVTAIILAAGRSSRLGSPKQLVEVEGQPLLRRTVQTALASRCERVLVVLGYQCETISLALYGLPVEIIENRQWCEGVASSIRTGIEVCENDEAVLLIPCDLPRLTTEHLDRLLDGFTTGAVLIASQWDDVCGPPALFASHFYAELKGLQGDTGARSILRKHHDILQIVNFPEGRYDLDTPDDLKEFV